MTVVILVLGIFLNFGPHVTSAWDIAVALKDQINFLNSMGGSEAQLSEGLHDVESLVYIGDLGQLYIVDNNRTDGSIFQVTVPKDVSGYNETVARPVVTKQNGTVRGVAYDDMTGVLYWTLKDTIKFMQINPTGQPQAGQLLYSLSGQEPLSIAIDICHRYLFWSYLSGVDRLHLDSSKQRITVVESDLENPNAVVVDYKNNQLFWVDERSGTQFQIESSDLDGHSRKVLYKGADHQPFTLAVSGTSVVWTDHIKRSVWSLELEPATLESPVPRRLGVYISSPRALAPAHTARWQKDRCNKVVIPQVEVIPATVTKMTSSTEDSPVSQPTCHNGGHRGPNEIYCVCPPGYGGDYCEKVAPPPVTGKVLVCHNGGAWREEKGHCDCLLGYSGVSCGIMETTLASSAHNTRSACLHGGQWRDQYNYCDCPSGYSGVFCEVDECKDYCLHDGRCRSQPGGPVCTCRVGYTGTRCEVLVCHNYCLSGHCTTDIEGQPQCHCMDGYSGVRCDVNYTQQQRDSHDLEEICQAFCKLWSDSEKDRNQPSDTCRCSELHEEEESRWWHQSRLVIAQFALILLLVAMVAILTRKVLVQRKRPRIKKRFIVNKNVTPLTCRPDASGDQCEITIENCCNMNICETPCFEPDLRQPTGNLSKQDNKGMKEEKANLLSGIELPPDDLY